MFNKQDVNLPSEQWLVLMDYVLIKLMPITYKTVPVVDMLVSLLV